MTIDGVNYRLTKHGRRRFIERVNSGVQSTDATIIICAYAGMPGFEFVWKPDGPHGDMRLVTVKHEKMQD